MYYGLYEIFLKANGTKGIGDSYVSKFEEKLKFSQLYDFLKRHKEHVCNSNIPHLSCLCEICENTSLLAKGLNRQKRKLQEKLPTRPHDLVEMFSCNSGEAVCMLEISLYVSHQIWLLKWWWIKHQKAKIVKVK